ncbi:MAG: prepilin peptidase [Candidatus Hydrothermarchaeales archaeon]
MVDTLLLRILSSLPILYYASFLDLKHREIDSRLWQSMVVLGVLFLLTDVYTVKNLKLFIPFVFILGIAVVFSVSLHYLGLIGGGDAKMLIGLAAMFPFLPSGNFILPAFFLSVFTNAIFIALLIPLWFFVSNLNLLPELKSPRDFLRLFVARKKDAKDVGGFEAVLDDDRFFISTKNVEFGSGGRSGEVWVTPAVPFVVLLAAGFVISIVYGDVLFPFFS